MILGIAPSRLEPTSPPTVRQVAEWLELFVEPDQVVGLVAFHVGRPNCTHAGYFDGRHLGRMANFAVALGRKAGGVYLTLNPVRPELLARRPNNAYVTAGRDWMPLTTNADIASRSYVFLDIDPLRPAESRGASATDGERAAAWSVAEDVVSLTDAGGWPGPLVGSSGNGFHLVYRTTRGSAAHKLRLVGDQCPVRHMLRRFALRFDTADVRIDTCVSNSARLVRVPGTPARKGTPTTERPHRVASVIGIPAGWQPGPRVGDPLPALDLPNEPDPPPVAAAVAYTGPTSADVMNRAVAYVRSLPASIQGQNGSGALMAAARATCWGFALGPDAGLNVLRDFFNPRAVPPWSETALTRVCERAMIDAERPFGYLLSVNGGDR